MGGNGAGLAYRDLYRDELNALHRCSSYKTNRPKIVESTTERSPIPPESQKGDLAYRISIPSKATGAILTIEIELGLRKTLFPPQAALRCD